MFPWQISNLPLSKEMNQDRKRRVNPDIGRQILNRAHDLRLPQGRCLKELPVLMKIFSDQSCSRYIKDRKQNTKYPHTDPNPCARAKRDAVYGQRDNYYKGNKNW